MCAFVCICTYRSSETSYATPPLPCPSTTTPPSSLLLPLVSLGGLGGGGCLLKALLPQDTIAGQMAGRGRLGAKVSEEATETTTISIFQGGGQGVTIFPSGYLNLLLARSPPPCATPVEMRVRLVFSSGLKCMGGRAKETRGVSVREAEKRMCGRECDGGECRIVSKDCVYTCVYLPMVWMWMSDVQHTAAL